jgi:hypothetical protein
MQPGHRTAPRSQVLHPEDHETQNPSVEPGGPPIQDSMTPGYERETNFLDETKRTLDVRRYNPVKNSKKKVAVSTPSSKELKYKMKNLF